MFQKSGGSPKAVPEGRVKPGELHMLFMQKPIISQTIRRDQRR